MSRSIELAGLERLGIRLFGSITHIGKADLGCHAITGSHGGMVVADYALRANLRSLICHDAGMGLDDAGIAGLEVLERHGIATAAVGHETARIGEPDDMLSNGRISAINQIAAIAGVRVGQSCREAAWLMASSPSAPDDRRPQVPSKPPLRLSLGQRRTALFHNDLELVCLDSASQISPGDAGRVVLTGSHGGLPGGNAANAIKAEVALAAFNDAGIGKDGAGIARLAALDAIGIPAFTVAAASAHIGDGHSTYETGVVSWVNDQAARLGIGTGVNVRDLFRDVLDS